MKSVLLHVDGGDGQEARFQAAVDIVRAMEGHLTCLQITVSMETYLPTDPYGMSSYMGDAFEKAREWETDKRKQIEERLRVEGIAWDWHAHPGNAAKLLADHSWLSELVVVSAPEKDWPGRLVSPPVAADVAVRARAPVLVVPNEAKGLDCGGVVVVAWNGSPEACQAVRAAVPLLKLAASVQLVTVESEDSPDFPPLEAAAFLSRHGVASEVVEVPAKGQSPDEVLRKVVSERKAAYLVMGAYGRSRLHERLLGGVTRELLIDPPAPLLLAH